jgi:hypothetical protein
MGPYGEAVIEAMRDHVRALSNSLISLHVQLLKLERHHGGSLPPNARLIVASATETCAAAMEALHELQVKI